MAVVGGVPQWSHNPYLPHSLRLATEGRERPVYRRVSDHALVFDRSGVPVGTTWQIQQWVAGDPERARTVLLRERGERKPRVTLVSYLVQVLRRHGVPVDPVVAVPVAPDGGDGASGDGGARVSLDDVRSMLLEG